MSAIKIQNTQSTPTIQSTQTENTNLTYTWVAKRKNEIRNVGTYSILWNVYMPCCFPFHNWRVATNDTLSYRIVNQNRKFPVIVDQSALRKVTWLPIIRSHESRVEKDVHRKFCFIRQVTVDESTSTNLQIVYRFCEQRRTSEHFVHRDKHTTYTHTDTQKWQF